MSPAAIGNPNSAEPEQSEMRAGSLTALLEGARDADHRRERAAAAGCEERDTRLPRRQAGSARSGTAKPESGQASKGMRYERTPHVVEEPASSRTPVDEVPEPHDDVEVLTQPEHVEHRTEHALSETPAAVTPARADGPSIDRAGRFLQQVLEREVDPANQAFEIAVRPASRR